VVDVGDEQSWNAEMVADEVSIGKRHSDLIYLARNVEISSSYSRVIHIYVEAVESRKEFALTS